MAREKSTELGASGNPQELNSGYFNEIPKLKNEIVNHLITVSGKSSDDVTREIGRQLPAQKKEKIGKRRLYLFQRHCF